MSKAKRATFPHERFEQPLEFPAVRVCKDAAQDSEALDLLDHVTAIVSGFDAKNAGMDAEHVLLRLDVSLKTPLPDGGTVTVVPLVAVWVARSEAVCLPAAVARSLHATLVKRGAADPDDVLTGELEIQHYVTCPWYAHNINGKLLGEDNSRRLGVLACTGRLDLEGEPPEKKNNAFWSGRPWQQRLPRRRVAVSGGDDGDEDDEDDEEEEEDARPAKRQRAD